MKKATFQLGIYVSGLLVAAGVFLPLTSIPVYGVVSYLDVATTESYLIVACALTAPWLATQRRPTRAIIPVSGIWLILAYPALQERFFPPDISLLDRVAVSIEAAFQQVAADLFFELNDLRWGGLLLLASLIALSYFTLAIQLKRKR